MRRALAAVALAAVLAGACSRAPDGADEAKLHRLQQIGESGSAVAPEREFLDEMLGSLHAEERAVAAWAAGAVGWTERVPRLATMVREDDSPDVRLNAVRSIALLGGPEAPATLLALLADPDEKIVAAALGGFRGPTGPAAIAAIGDLAGSAGDDLRPVALDALVRIGDPATMQHLLDATADPVAKARSLSAFGLGKLRDPAAIPRLQALLGDDEWEVRANAAQALGMIGDARARPALEKATGDPHGPVRDAAERALERLK